VRMHNNAQKHYGNTLSVILSSILYNTSTQHPANARWIYIAVACKYNVYSNKSYQH